MGEPPFSRGQIEYQILNEQPEPLDPHFAKSGSVMQGLAKKPEDRPKTCAAVLEGDASPRGGARTRRNEDGRASTYAEATVDREHVESVEGRGVSMKKPLHDAPVAQHSGRDGSTSHPPDAGTHVAQERNVSGGALPVICVMAAFAVLVGGLWYRGAQRRESADRDRCIENLKQIEAAMEQCLMGGEIPTPERLYGPDRYIRNEPTCPLGGHYKINKSDTGYTVVCPHADEGHRWPLSGAPNIIKANWGKEITAPKPGVELFIR